VQKCGVYRNEQSTVVCIVQSTLYVLVHIDVHNAASSVCVNELGTCAEHYVNTVQCSVMQRVVCYVQCDVQSK
jgi:hypothetical protein